MSKQTLPYAILVVAIVIAVLVGLGPRLAAAQTTPSVAPATVVRTVSVSATGTVSATPDQATIQLGVRTEANTAAEALDENNTRMEALLAALRQAGIAARDIQTSDFSIWPQYRSASNGTSSISGYEVSNRVTVTVRDLANFGRTLDAVVRAGGNQVNAIQFGFSDPDALLDQAREAAMAEAQRKATQLAGLAEVELGTVVTISESGLVPPPILMARGAAMMDDAASAVPIESGESEVRVDVQVTYELVP